MPVSAEGRVENKKLNQTAALLLDFFLFWKGPKLGPFGPLGPNPLSGPRGPRGPKGPKRDNLGPFDSEALLGPLGLLGPPMGLLGPMGPLGRLGPLGPTPLYGFQKKEKSSKT